MKKMIGESKLMFELEERRAAHAKRMEGLSIEEKLKIYTEEGKRATKAMGLDLPKAEHSRK